MNISDIETGPRSGDTINTSMLFNSFWAKWYIYVSVNKAINIFNGFLLA